MTTPTTPTATATSPPRRGATGRGALNKVPEVTVWFWIIKILCTTVGESFADYVNTTLGFGLTGTTLLFTAVFAVVLTVQFRTDRYRPFPYWLTVVVVSVTGTLCTDMLTDQRNVPLWISSTVFSVLLALVFGIWWLRERTLSIHGITTFPREAFYWLTVLVTFALGTATGDWTLELTGWTPATSVLLPLGLIAAITGLWRFGADPVLSFWLAYILTRPLGANIGDWLASPKTAAGPGEPVGLGLGTFATSLIFLGAILATVVYLAISRRDVTGTRETPREAPGGAATRRERIALGGFGALAVATVALLLWAHGRPHTTCDPTGRSETLPACPRAPMTAHQKAAAVAGYEQLARTAAAQDRAGATTASRTTVQTLRDTWDADATSLQAVDSATWTLLDDQMDEVLKTFAIDHGSIAPAPAAEQEKQLDVLLRDLAGHPFR
ncbi:COG4705 family protein [Streptomyces sp. NPDC004031]